MSGAAAVPRSQARIRRTDDPQEPLPETLAADLDIAQEWNGVEMPADGVVSRRAFRHHIDRSSSTSMAPGDRVLSLLLLESAAPREWDIGRG
jgi:hypothetical protein